MSKPSTVLAPVPNRAPECTEPASEHVATSPMLLLDADELAAALRLSRWTVYRWGKAGLIPSVKLGRKTRFELDRVVDALRSGAARNGGSRQPVPLRVSRANASKTVRVVRSPRAPASRSESMTHDERMRAAIEATRVLDK